MYIALTKNKIYQSQNLKFLNKKMKANFEQEEFYAIGKDYIVNLDEHDIRFVQDKKRIQSIAINKLFKKNSTERLLLIAILILTIAVQVRL